MDNDAVRLVDNVVLSLQLTVALSITAYSMQVKEPLVVFARALPLQTSLWSGKVAAIQQQ